MLKNGTPYRDLGANRFSSRDGSKTIRHEDQVA
jgi:hypothetical protein